MRFISFLTAVVLTIYIAHAQQYAWQVIARTSTTYLLAVDFVDTLHGWCAGRDSVYRTTDGGSTWRGSSIPFGGSSKQSISFCDTLRGWAVGFFAGSSVGVIWRTTNGGLTWTERQDDNRNYRGTAVRNITGNTTSGYVNHFSIDTALVVQTSNGGTSWQEQRFGANTRLFKVMFVDSLHGWINGTGGLYRTTDGGDSWQVYPTPNFFTAFMFLDTVRGWGASGGIFYRTTNGGTGWDSLYRIPGPPINLDGFGANDLSFTDTLYGWAFGVAVDQGIITEAIYRTTNGGISWYRESIGLTGDFGDLAEGIMLDRTHGWAVAGDGRVLGYRLVTSVERLAELPRKIALRQNYPNPFNPATNIEYELDERNHVVVGVFDVQGREVETLVDQVQEAGVYRVRFDASHLASGSYICVLQAGDYREAKQMMLLK